MRISKLIPILTIFCTIILPTLIFGYVQQSQTLMISTPAETEVAPTVCDNKYIIPVLLGDGKILQIDLEEYVLRVVLREMPAEFELEALKAQAVVARTYTLRRNELGGKHDLAVVCTDSGCCQGYCRQDEFLANGGTNEMLEKVQQAVEETEGHVIVYNGELAEATYFACSGGKTEDAQAVWGADIPYLKSTVSPGEEKASHYIDTVTFSSDEFQNLLGIEFLDISADWLGTITYTKGGGVEKIIIAGEVYSGLAIRQRLGLRSTAFLISADGDRITITTKGFGHRVGMSQYGAEAMAVNGSKYNEILSHYYSGTELKCITN